MSFSRLNHDNQKTVFTIIGLGVAGTFTLYWVRKWMLRKKLPTEWEEVGTVSQLLVYPIKSAKPISLQSAEAAKKGLGKGLLLDRSFVVISEDGQVITGRQAGILVTMATEFAGSVLTIRTKTGDSVSVDILVVNKTNKRVQFKLRGDPVQGVDCGTEVAEWLSRHLFQHKTKVRLIYVGGTSWYRKTRLFDFFKFPTMHEGDTTAYGDYTSYNINTEASLADLNARISRPVTIDYFRPIVVVGGTKPFEEDEWKYVKIGNRVVLRFAKPNERCILPTVSPNTGERTTEHIDELKKYRLIKHPKELATSYKNNPIFGIHCGIDVTGTISVGDKVSVYREKPYWNCGV